jgi:hypothetical protein
MLKLRIVKPIGRLLPGDTYEVSVVDSVILRAFGIAELYDGEQAEQPLVLPEEGDVSKKQEEEKPRKKKKKKKSIGGEPLDMKRNTYGRRDMRAEE